MMQQVNLYQAAARQARIPWGGATIVRGVALAGALLLLVAGALLGDTLRLSAQVDELHQRHDQAARQLLDAQRRFPPRPKDPRLEAEIARLQVARDQRQPLGGILGTLTATPTSPFGAALAGLARQTPDGVWLRHIVLGAADGSLRMDGSALQAEAPLRLVESLAGEEAFAGARFRRLQLTRGDGEYVDFSLSTGAGKEGP